MYYYQIGSVGYDESHTYNFYSSTNYNKAELHEVIKKALKDVDRSNEDPYLLDSLADYVDDHMFVAALKKYDLTLLFIKEQIHYNANCYRETIEIENPKDEDLDFYYGKFKPEEEKGLDQDLANFINEEILK